MPVPLTNYEQLYPPPPPTQSVERSGIQTRPDPLDFYLPPRATRLRTADCGPWTADCGLWTVDCGL